MPITVVCHKCATLATVPDSAAGTQCRCPHCGADVQIPGGVAKHCCVCQADVANAPRTRDAAGNYYCAPCGAKASAALAHAAKPAADLAVPALTDAGPAARCVLCKAEVPGGKVVNFNGQLVCHRCAAAEGLGTVPYRLRKPPLGAARVVYHCPRCRGELESALAEAGKPDACPQCGCDLEVPGRYEAFKAQQLKPADPWAAPPISGAAEAPTTPDIPPGSPPPTEAAFFGSSPGTPAVDSQPAPPPNRWLWPVVVGAVVIVVLVVVAAAFLVIQLRSMRRQAQEQHRALAAATTAVRPTPPAPSAQPVAQPVAEPSAKPVSKPPAKPVLAAAQRAAVAAAEQRMERAATKVLDQPIFGAGPGGGAERGMERAAIKVLDQPIFGAGPGGGVALLTTGVAPKANSMIRATGVKAFRVVLPPQAMGHRGGTLSLAAAKARPAWVAGTWYPAAAANLIVWWKSSSGALATAKDPRKPIAQIQISSGNLRISKATGYSSQDRREWEAAEQMVVDVLVKGNKVERIQFLPKQPATKVVALNARMSTFLHIPNFKPGRAAALVVESFHPAAAKLSFKVSPPSGNSPASVVVQLPSVRGNGAVKNDWGRVYRILKKQRKSVPRACFSSESPPAAEAPPPLRFSVLPTGVENNFVAVRSRLGNLAAKYRHKITLITKMLVDPRYKLSTKQARWLKAGQHPNLHHDLRLGAMAELPANLKQLKRDYQARQGRVKQCQKALKSLKEITLRVELYPGGPVLSRVTYKNKP